MKKTNYTGIFTIALFVCLVACNNGVDTPATPPPPQPASLSYTIQRVLPHDTSSFTEGLLIYKGSLYEGIGEHGKSKLLKIDLNTGKVEKQLDLDQKYFGEGIVILRDTIYQLTWTEKAVFVYTMDFKKINEFTITTNNGQGWGMTTD
jgi:glutamine cyclotransferase